MAAEIIPSWFSEAFAQEVLENIAHVPSVEVPDAVAKRLRTWLGDEHVLAVALAGLANWMWWRGA